MYADGSTDPKYLNLMLKKIKNNSREKKSLVFCSRYHKDGGSFDDNALTRIGNFFFTLLGNVFFSLKLSDILFTCLNNGEIKLRFGELETYKNYIQNNIGVTHEFLDDLICYKYNINTFIFEKRISKRINENPKPNCAI